MVYVSRWLTRRIAPSLVGYSHFISNKHKRSNCLIKIKPKKYAHAYDICRFWSNDSYYFLQYQITKNASNSLWVTWTSVFSHCERKRVVWRWPSREEGGARVVWPSRNKAKRIFLLVRAAPRSRPILRYVKAPLSS